VIFGKIGEKIGVFLKKQCNELIFAQFSFVSYVEANFYAFLAIFLNRNICPRSLTKQSHVIFNQKLWYVMLEQFLMKYVWAGER
jgi:hypothetical protein